MLLLVGDIHGHFSVLRDLIKEKNPDLTICLGDFGYWPNFEGQTFKNSLSESFVYSLDPLKEILNEIWWIDGNHEDHLSLIDREKNTFLSPNIAYIPRGTIAIIPKRAKSPFSGKKALFIGGADSIDSKMRTPYVDWFPEETLSHKDFEFMNDSDTKFDMVFSHSAPFEFGDWSPYNTEMKFTRNILSHILKNYQPERWYFGHFHETLSGFTNGCNWKCINTIENSGYLEC